MAGPHCAVRPAAWQLASSCCLLLVLASRATGARTLAQAPSPASGAADDPLSNIVPQDPAKLYQSWQNSTDSDSLVAYRGDMEMRLIGEQFIPFSLDKQRLVVRAAQELFLPNGPAQLLAFREVWPDPSAPGGTAGGGQGGVELKMTYWLLNNATENGTAVSTWDGAGAQAYVQYLNFAAMVLELGGWKDAAQPELLNANFNPSRLTGGFTLHTLTAVVARLRVQLAGTDGAASGLQAEQASAVSGAVQAAVVTQYHAGTLVEVTNFTGADSQGWQLLTLEVTLFTCRDGATVPTPECERQVLAALMAKAQALPDTQQAWQAAGIKSVEVVDIAERQLPPRPANDSAVAAGNSTAAAGSAITLGQQSWQLERIMQPVAEDGSVLPAADGTGVNVYIISSGVQASHEQFGYTDGSPGSRVIGGWGFGGLNPQQDCKDYDVWYGFGTHHASICCGRTLGVARNATIHSVRFREKCMGDSKIWAAGGLPAALDLILSTAVKPAVVLIDTWISLERVGGPEVGAPIKAELEARLDGLVAANITVVAAAGPGFGIVEPCDNIIAAHPVVISVSASDVGNQATAFATTNSSCIDIWAPSGGVGVGIVGAYPASPSSYIRVNDRAFGAAPYVAGVAAQYLQLHPNASAVEVRQALLSLARQHSVTGTGISPAALLSTNLTMPGAGGSRQGPQQAAASGQSNSTAASSSAQGSSSSGLSTGAVVAIAVVAALGVAAVVAASFVLLGRKKRRQQLLAGYEAKSLPGSRDYSWDIDEREIAICSHSNGSEWLLGEGQYGRVYKAMKGDVQVVAVKTLSNVDDKFKAQFLRERDMMKHVSRDANICQFFGACVRGGNLMLVSEFMEGGDLFNAIAHDAQHQLQWYRAGKDVMLDVVRGIHFLHSNGIIHRDIKSKNILLDRAGRAKLADVGLATLLDETRGGGGGKEQEGGFVGTLAWAAPEVLTEGKSTEKADMFSLGVVLWEVVTQEAPLRGRMRDVVVPEEAPKGVAAAIAACMQVDPEQRPTALELYAMLLDCPPFGSHDSAPPPLYRGVSTASPPRSNSTNSSGGRSPAAVNLAAAPWANMSPGRRSGRLGGNLSVTATTPNGSSDLGSWPAPVQRASWSGSEQSHSSKCAPDLAMVIDFRTIEFAKRPDGSDERLGQGAYGSVYKVTLDQVQPLACKVMNIGEDPAMQAAFVQEAQILWKLRHPNIVSLSGISVHDGKGYMLMELMDGGTLFKLVNARSRVTKQRVFGWYARGKQVALDIAKALHYLHSMKISHFDIKSGNVLLTKELGAKLADVGLARILSATHHSLSSALIPGTFAYMAPELLQGKKCTPAVDIYSFGILLGELCTGTHPERGRELDIRAPEDCPQAVLNLLHQCTADKPEARPTARDLVERLSALQ